MHQCAHTPLFRARRKCGSNTWRPTKNCGLRIVRHTPGDCPCRTARPRPRSSSRPRPRRRSAAARDASGGVPAAGARRARRHGPTDPPARRADTASSSTRAATRSSAAPSRSGSARPSRRQRPRAPRERRLAPHRVRLGGRHGGPAKTEQFLTVVERQGPKTWRWHLKSLDLTPRVGDDGAVGFIRNGRLLSDVAYIEPVRILDGAAGDVTPADARWSVAESGGRWYLELALDDAVLPIPYVIDPAISNRSVGVSTPNAAGAPRSFRSRPASSPATS